jgi:arylsulfatase A-like enzyme
MARRPNVLIYMTDQEQGQVSLPGHPCATPNADRLAAEGVQFTRAYCPAPHCCPSRASFMTGLFPSGHGVYNNVSTSTAIRTGLRPGVRTFSEGLAEAGYRMLFSGKWHVSDTEGPADRGWDELEVTSGKGASAAYKKRDVQRWPASTTGARGRGVVRRPGWGDYRLYETLSTDSALGYDSGRDWDVVTAGLSALTEAGRSDQPWCLYVGPLGPHDPFRVPDVFARRYDPAQVPLPDNYADDLRDKPSIYRRQRDQIWGQLGADEVREAIAHYWAYCEMQDVYLGLLLDALDSTGQREDTLVLKLSDHGDYAGAHGLFCKGVAAFDEGSRVPCVASWPAGIADPGRVEDSFVGLTDIAPTLLELAGVDVGGDLMHGRSLTPFFRGETPDDWPQERCSQFNGVELYYTQRAVQTRDHKYVYNGFDFDELYDLQADPAEMVNLAGDRDYDDVKHDLVQRMWRFAAKTHDHVFNSYATVALAPWGPGDALG